MVLEERGLEVALVLRRRCGAPLDEWLLLDGSESGAMPSGRSDGLLVPGGLGTLSPTRNDHVPRFGPPQLSPRTIHWSKENLRMFGCCVSSAVVSSLCSSSSSLRPPPQKQTP